MISFFSRTSRTIGIDLGGSAIKIATIRTGKGRKTVEQLLRFPMRDGLIVEGRIFDLAGVSERLRRLHELVDFEGAAVVSATRVGHEALFRYVEGFPRLPYPKAKIAMLTERSLGFPIPPKDGTFDLVILNPEETGATMRILGFAARKEMIEDRQRVFEDANLPLHAIDMDAVALYNLHRLCFSETAGVSRAVLVNLGLQTTVHCTVRNGELAQGKIVTSTGVQGLLEQIYTDLDDLGTTPAEDLLNEEIRILHQDVFDQWASDIARDIETSAQAGDPDDSSVGEVFLTGGGAMIPGLRDRIGRVLNTTVHVFNPLEHMTLGEAVRPMMADGPLYAIALGLALRDDL